MLTDLCVLGLSLWVRSESQTFFFAVHMNAAALTNDITTAAVILSEVCALSALFILLRHTET